MLVELTLELINDASQFAALGGCLLAGPPFAAGAHC
jgi:hypothetical protein